MGPLGHRGATTATHDGFGELLTLDDALGRHFVFTYDALGRRVRRDDTVLGTTYTTTWTFDTAPNGTGGVALGRLASVKSPANHVDAFTYDPLGRPLSHALTLGDTGETFFSQVDYDTLGRPWHVTYPAVKNAGGLTVRREYDAFGALVALHDDHTQTTFWQLQERDGAGRAAGEMLGNGVLVGHAYVPASGLLHHAGAQKGQTKKHVTLQDLTYAYDLGLRMTSRSDGLQKGIFGPATESFLHDALDRITCASFAPILAKPWQTPPCDTPIAYHDNGNIKAKGGFAYGYDVARPHAVTSVGSDGFAYDPVGNQTSRPGVTSIAYTTFDLPSTYTLADSSVVALDHDGDQHRIRKRTAQRETVYLDDAYERVSDFNGKVQHRYYVAAGSSTVVLTRAVAAPSQVAYMLTEALGSVDVVTDGAGQVIERRSYDAFGARRDPAWGSGGTPPPPKVSPLGFTGQEGDDELGLVNMKGRIYDPRVGRFLSTDPLVPQPGYSQSWNPYTYAWNSPLRFTDPSGFEGGVIGVPETVIVGKKPSLEQQLGGAIDRARANGAPYKVVENGSGGDTSQLTIFKPGPGGDDTRAKDAARDDTRSTAATWKDGPDVQRGGGFVAGAAIGYVPFGFLFVELARRNLAPPTAEFNEGLATGQVVGGVAAAKSAMNNQGGGAAAATNAGVLAFSGVGALVKVAVVVTGAAANIATALQTTGSGGGGVRITSRNWKARDVNDPACENGCESVARQIQKQVGGEIKRIRADALERLPLGRYREKNFNWFFHEVVVKDGRVYDAFTGGSGLPIQEYKALWRFGDVLDFGF